MSFDRSGQQTNSDGDRPLVDVEVAGMQIERGTAGGAHPEANVGAGYFTGEPGEVVAAPALLRCFDGLVAERNCCGLTDDAGDLGIVHHRGNAVGVEDVQGRARALDERTEFVIERSGELVPHRQRRGADRCLQDALGGDHVGGVAGVDGPEHQLDQRIGLLVETPHPRSHACGQVSDDAGSECDHVDGQLGASGVAARARQGDHGQVGGRGDRAGLEPDGADIEFRLAVQADDRVDPIEAVVGDDIECAARYPLLGGLENEPDRSGELVAMVREVERRAQHDRGVHVVAAGMGNARYLAPIGDALLVGHRQSVEISTQCEPSAGRLVDAGRQLVGGDVAHQARPHGEPTRLEPGES